MINFYRTWSQWSRQIHRIQSRSEQAITKGKWEKMAKCSERWISPPPQRQVAQTKSKTMIGSCSEPKFVRIFVQHLKQAIKIKALTMIWNRKLCLAVVENRQEFCWIVTVMTSNVSIVGGSLDQRCTFEIHFNFVKFKCVFKFGRNEFFADFFLQMDRIIGKRCKKCYSLAKMGSDPPLSLFSLHYPSISFSGIIIDIIRENCLNICLVNISFY